MDRLKQIESFVSVALKGSLTAAALVEGVAPAVMGRRIDALESRLGVKLLVRTTRRITLTHEGSAFLEDCQHLLTAFADAEAPTVPALSLILFADITELTRDSGKALFLKLHSEIRGWLSRRVRG